MRAREESQAKIKTGISKGSIQLQTLGGQVIIIINK